MKDFNWRSSRNPKLNMKSSAGVLILLIAMTTKVSLVLLNLLPIKATRDANRIANKNSF